MIIIITHSDPLRIILKRTLPDIRHINNISECRHCTQENNHRYFVEPLGKYKLLLHRLYQPRLVCQYLTSLVLTFITKHNLNSIEEILD